jgi:cystathionine beta-synthase
MENKMNVYNNILELVGNTPLLRLNNSVKHMEGRYFAKCEFFNPGLAAKDRIAVHIIEQLEQQGKLKKGVKVIETTSGNTGFSLAMVCALKGYECILAVNSKATPGKIDMLKTMGAKIYVCPGHVSADNPSSYYQVAKRLHEENPGSVYINQYFNDQNTEAHYRTTGPEIWEQTNGEVTHLIAASGTGGTISGIAKYLKEKNKSIKILGVDAYGSILKKYHETGEIDLNEAYSYTIEGMGKNLIPSATRFDLIDFYEKVTDEDAANKARDICLEEGVMAGYTSGAVVQAAIQLHSKGFFDKNSKVVLVFSDHGTKYMEKIYSDDWMNDKKFLTKNSAKQHAIEYVKAVEDSKVM